jgi:hypothetical protein
LTKTKPVSGGNSIGLLLALDRLSRDCLHRLPDFFLRGWGIDKLLSRLYRDDIISCTLSSFIVDRN